MILQRIGKRYVLGVLIERNMPECIGAHCVVAK